MVTKRNIQNQESEDYKENSISTTRSNSNFRRITRSQNNCDSFSKSLPNCFKKKIEGKKKNKNKKIKRIIKKNENNQNNERINLIEQEEDSKINFQTTFKKTVNFSNEAKNLKDIANISSQKNYNREKIISISDDDDTKSVDQKLSIKENRKRNIGAKNEKEDSTKITSIFGNSKKHKKEPEDHQFGHQIVHQIEIETPKILQGKTYYVQMKKSAGYDDTREKTIITQKLRKLGADVVNSKKAGVWNLVDGLICKNPTGRTITNADLKNLPIIYPGWVDKVFSSKKFIAYTDFLYPVNIIKELKDEESRRVTKRRLKTQKKKIKQEQDEKKNLTEYKKNKKMKIWIFNNIVENTHQQPEKVLNDLNTLYGINDDQDRDKRLIKKIKRQRKSKMLAINKKQTEIAKYENYYKIGYQGKLCSISKIKEIKNDVKFILDTDSLNFSKLSLFIRDPKISGSVGYLYSLVNDIPIVHYDWVKECIISNEFLDPSNKKYELKPEINKELLKDKKIGVYSVKRDGFIRSEDIGDDLVYKTILNAIHMAGGTFEGNSIECNYTIIPPGDYETLIKDYTGFITMGDIVRLEWLSDSIEENFIKNHLNEIYSLNDYRFGTPE